MNKKWTLLILGLLLLVLAVFLLPDSRKDMDILETEETQMQETQQPTAPYEKMPDSVLYYGEITKVKQDETGNPVQLVMESQRDGTFVMNLGEPTCYIDSGERTSFGKELLEAGQRVYVFHSSAVARTLPPQAAAYAVLRNIPMDASCGMYHEVEKLEQLEGRIRITTDNGKRVLEIDGDSQVLSYEGEILDGSALKEGSYIIGWYWDRGEEILHASHVMILPDRNTED